VSALTWKWYFLRTARLRRTSECAIEPSTVAERTRRLSQDFSPGSSASTVTELPRSCHENDTSPSRELSRRLPLLPDLPLWENSSNYGEVSPMKLRFPTRAGAALLVPALLANLLVGCGYSEEEWQRQLDKYSQLEN